MPIPPRPITSSTSYFPIFLRSPLAISMDPQPAKLGRPSQPNWNIQASTYRRVRMPCKSRFRQILKGEREGSIISPNGPENGFSIARTTVANSHKYGSGSQLGEFRTTATLAQSGLATALKMPRKQHTIFDSGGCMRLPRLSGVPSNGGRRATWSAVGRRIIPLKVVIHVSGRRSNVRVGNGPRAVPRSGAGPGFAGGGEAAHGAGSGAHGRGNC